MALVLQGEGAAQDFAPHDEFLRRISPDWVKPDGSLMTLAFRNTTGTDRMSVNWAALSSVDDTLIGWEWHGVVSVTAELCWCLNQKIERTPTADNPAHCDVVGYKSESVKRKFARAGKWLRYPESRDSQLGDSTER